MISQSAQLTSKGQLTLPKRIRDRLEVTSGDRIEFVEDESGPIYLRARSIRVAGLAGIPKRRGRKPVTVEEMNEAIATAAAERYERAIGRR